MICLALTVKLKIFLIHINVFDLEIKRYGAVFIISLLEFLIFKKLESTPRSGL